MPSKSTIYARSSSAREAERASAASGAPSALDGVIFAVERGECVAILGQNGSGKSTLVRLLSTLLLPDGGRALVFGHDVVSATPRAVRRLVNRVSVEASFFKKMSAVENLSYAARFYGLTAALDARPHSRRSSSASASPPTGATSRWRTSRAECSRRSRSPGRCSPRRCCSCSTSRRPGSTRAPSSRCRSSSARCAQLHDATILLCTHDMAEAEALADRVGILDAGRLLVLEPADDLKRRYDAETLEEAFFAATGRAFEEERGRRGGGGMTALQLQDDCAARAGRARPASSSATATSSSATSGGTSRSSSGRSRTRSRSSSSRRASRRRAARSTSTA